MFRRGERLPDKPVYGLAVLRLFFSNPHRVFPPIRFSVPPPRHNARAPPCGACFGAPANKKSLICPADKGRIAFVVPPFFRKRADLPLSPSISLTRKTHFRAARGCLSLRGARAAFSPDRALCPCRMRRYSSRSSPDISYTVLHFPAVVNRLQLDDLAPVEVAALEAVDQHLGRRDIRRDRDVVHVAKAQ